MSMDRAVIRGVIGGVLLTCTMWAGCHKPTPIEPVTEPPVVVVPTPTPTPTPIPTPDPTPTPQPTPTPTPTPEPQPKPVGYGRTIHLCPFFVTDFRYGVLSAPGNCEVIVDGSNAETRADKSNSVIANMDDPLTLGVGSGDTVEAGKLLAVWFALDGSGGYDAASYNKHRAFADNRGVPMLVYVDSPSYHPNGRALLRNGDWAGIMAYPTSGADTVSAIIDRLDATNSHLAWSKVALIRPLYTRSGQFPVQLILDVQDPLTKWVREHSNVVADLPFSWGRPSGALDNPPFQDALAKLDRNNH